MQIATIGIVGYGAFGRFLYSLARERLPHLTVKVSSSHNQLDGATFFPLEDVCQSDLLILCVPISAFSETLDAVLPYVGEKTIICDVATVKMHTASILRKLQVPRFIATHPMFGPYSYEKQGGTLAGLRVAICDSSLPADELQATVDFLQNAGLIVLQITPDEHDRLIAETLFLTHLVGQTVKAAGFERTAIDTVSFGFLMDAVESVENDEALFRDVAKYNPYCADVLAKFERAEQGLAASLRNEERAQ